ncbi:MAG: sigma-54 dependent transcriptional regulator [Proteobacteria bacterium]|nr:sigma-54-dependent Fis family transcriptional regulator [Desulfobacula sp.]MBU4130863.1 sigma-54 dependent transcriptional regulator [Pseudomonadota bacterium]
MPGHRIFIILENPKERMAYVGLFEDLGFLVDAVPDGTTALEYLVENKPDIVIADDTTPGFPAIEFLKTIADTQLDCKTIIITPEPVVDYAVNLMRHGAMDYLVKPVDLRQLELSARRALLSKIVDVPQEEKRVRNQNKQATIITQDPGMLNLLKLASRVADSSASILIQGESGTGKELFAKYLHEKSRRHAGPFVAINCAALPENLLESELFGHEKGAFTGAISRKLGKFELASQGTLFLDEITEMQFHLQAKLLRVIQERVVDRVGGTEPVEVDVRVIATTNRNAMEAVESGSFRKDLYYRLNTIPLVIPPLRDRIGDLLLLCDFFIKKYCKIDGRDVKGMTNQTIAFLSAHPFSGNVRELENIIHRSVLLADSEFITPKDLLLDGVDFQADLPEESAEQGSLDLSTGSLREMEQKMIFQTLDQTEGNRTHAAKILGISVRTLRNKLNEYKESL